MRARAVWATLSLMIVGGALVHTERALAGATCPEPTEARLVPGPHKVIPYEAAIYPELHLVANQESLVSKRHIDRELIDTHPWRRAWVWLKNIIRQELLCVRVSRDFWQLVANSLAKSEFDWKGLAFSKITEGQVVNPGAGSFFGIANFAQGETKCAYCRSDNREFDSDSGTSAEHGGIGTGFSSLDGGLHVIRLTISEVSQNARSENQADGCGEQRERPSNKPLVGILFFFAILCLLGTFLRGLRAGYHLYEKRRGCGALWLPLGGLSGLCAMYLVVAA